MKRKKKEQMIFKKNEAYSPRNKKEKQLCDALLKLKSREEAANFLRDLLTVGEIEEFANRLEMANLLTNGKSYLEVAKECHTSTTTVSRVAHWLFKGCGGYWKILSNTNK